MPSAEPAPSLQPTQSRAAPTQSELALLLEARRSAASNPAHTLSLLERHRSEFPRSELIQERELILIDALERLGRTGQARARAAAFRHDFPRSAHLGRLEVLESKL